MVAQHLHVNGGTESGGVVTWPTFDLAAGDSETRTVSLQLDDPLPAGINTLTNAAAVVVYEAWRQLGFSGSPGA